MTHKYNIGLEVSTIGLANLKFDRGYNKTGIYRVTADLTEALLQRNDLNIYPVFWEHPYTSEFGMEYLFRKGLSPRDFEQISVTEKKLYEAICNWKIISKRHVIANLVSKGIQHIRRFNGFKKFHIFHSLYYPNPDHDALKDKVMIRTIHDLIPIKYPQFFSKKHRDRFLCNINRIDADRDYIFAVSKATKNDVCEYLKINEDRVFVNHLAASKTKFYPDTDENSFTSLKKRLGINENGYFLSVATLEPRKNISTVLKAFTLLLNKNLIDSDIKLLLVGKKGWMIDRFLNDVEKNGKFKRNIVVTGFLKDDELRVLYSNALSFVYTSFYEGFGLPVLEAMQCGAPVIVSNRSSIPEVVGNAGILVNPLEIDEVCEAMLKIYEETYTREVCREKGLKRSELFSWTKTAERTVDGYKKAMMERGTN